MAAKTLTFSYSHVRDTKNKKVYQDDADESQKLYVDKTDASKLGDPAKLKVTLTAGS